MPVAQVKIGDPRARLFPHGDRKQQAELVLIEFSFVHAYDLI